MAKTCDKMLGQEEWTVKKDERLNDCFLSQKGIHQEDFSVWKYYLFIMKVIDGLDEKICFMGANFLKNVRINSIWTEILKNSQGLESFILYIFVHDCGLWIVDSKESINQSTMSMSHYLRCFRIYKYGDRICRMGLGDFWIKFKIATKLVFRERTNTMGKYSSFEYSSLIWKSRRRKPFTR